jgi:shikimate kinase
MTQPKNFNHPKRIFIVSHKGAGKALLTEALAKKLGWQYIDADPSLERYFMRSMHDIVGKQGEEAFHQFEAEVISYYKNKDHVVVALDEGVISTEKNRKLLSSEYVIYLKISIPTQLERMKSGRVSVLPIDDVKSFLEKQHLERNKFYEDVATLTIDSVSVEDDVNKILKAVEDEVNKIMNALK